MCCHKGDRLPTVSCRETLYSLWRTRFNIRKHVISSTRGYPYRHRPQSDLRPVRARPFQQVRFCRSAVSVAIAEITGEKRSRPLVDARHIAMYVTRQMTKLSYPDIGREFGGRDHTTVLHAVRRVEKDMNGQGHMAKQVQAVMVKAEDMTHRSEESR